MSKKQTVVLTKKEWQDRWVWTTGAGRLNYLRLHDENLQYLDSKTQQVKTYPLFTNAIWNLQVQNNAQTVVFQQGQSLFIFDLQNGLAKNLVTYRKSKAETPLSDGLSQTEHAFFESIRKQELQSTKFDLPTLKFISFEHQGALQVDPSARFVLLKDEQEPKEKATEVPHYISADAHAVSYTHLRAHET